MRAGRGHLGDLVAKGNTSDVWQWSRGRVVKVLRPGIPANWAALEADITARVHEAGLPAPATDGVVDIDGRPGIVFERIDGPSMWSRIKASPSGLPGLIEQLVDLQAGLHAAGPPEGLPELVARTRDKIEVAEQLSARERADALDLLHALPKGAALCHGDMHPANVLMSSRGIVIVDWFDAAVGHPVADLARSSLLMRPPSSAQSSSTFLDGATRGFLHLVHATYLAAIAKRGLVGAMPFDAWEAVMAAARISEPVPTADLISFWRHRDAGSNGTWDRRAGSIRARSQVGDRG